MAEHCCLVQGVGVILGLYRDNGEENGNYHSGLRI